MKLYLQCVWLFIHKWIIIYFANLCDKNYNYDKGSNNKSSRINNNSDNKDGNSNDNYEEKNLFNLFIKHGYVPADFKTSAITPVVEENKHKNLDDICNYRLVKIISVLSNLFEASVLSNNQR